MTDVTKQAAPSGVTVDMIGERIARVRFSNPARRHALDAPLLEPPDAQHLAEQLTLVGLGHRGASAGWGSGSSVDRSPSGSPSSRARFNFSGEREVPITVPPAALTSCTAAVPTPPPTA